MKNFFALPLIIALAAFCSCQKQTTEEEIRAMIKQEVQQQIAAEREAQEKELAQRRAQFNARRNALLDKKGAAGNTLAPRNPQGPIRPVNPATASSPGTIRRPQLPPGVTLPERSGATLPEFTRRATPPPAGSSDATSKTSAFPPVTPADSVVPSVSQLPEAAAESASPTPTPGADGTAQ